MDHMDRKLRMGFAEYYDPNSPFDHSLLAARWYFFKVYLERHPEAAADLRKRGLAAWNYLEQPQADCTLSTAYYLWLTLDINEIKEKPWSWVRESLSAVNAVVNAWLREQPWPPLLKPAAYRIFAVSAFNAVACWETQDPHLSLNELEYVLIYTQNQPRVNYDAISMRLNLFDISVHYHPVYEFWERAGRRLRYKIPCRKARRAYRHAVEGVYEEAGWRKTPTKRRRVLTPRLQFEHAHDYLMRPKDSLENITDELNTTVGTETFRANVSSILYYLFYGTGIESPLSPIKPRNRYSRRNHADASVL